VGAFPRLAVVGGESRSRNEQSPLRRKHLERSKRFNASSGRASAREAAQRDATTALAQVVAIETVGQISE
jgi:hypothetical protein